MGAHDGKLARCKAEETQPGHGFDEAALKLVPMLQMTPGLMDGEPAPCRGTSQVPIRFAIAP